jgi:hypothetical protein
MSISGLAEGEVLSVQSDDPFDYTITLADPTTTTSPPTTTTSPNCPDCQIIEAVQVNWRCVEPNCSWPDWPGSAIVWPSSTAYSTNLRQGFSARQTFDWAGNEVFPYMGPWADGCEVTSIAGVVLIIEWERGTETWRETLLQPGETHVIDLVGSENNAMLESPYNYELFTVGLRNCTPQPLPS